MAIEFIEYESFYSSTDGRVFVEKNDVSEATVNGVVSIAELDQILEKMKELQEMPSGN